MEKEIKKLDIRRISPVQHKRFRKKLEVDENDNISVIEDYVNEIEERVEVNRSNNEELYRMILEIKDKLEILENLIYKPT